MLIENEIPLQFKTASQAYIKSQDDEDDINFTTNYETLNDIKSGYENLDASFDSKSRVKQIEIREPLF